MICYDIYIQIYIYIYKYIYIQIYIYTNIYTNIYLVYIKYILFSVELTEMDLSDPYIHRIAYLITAKSSL